MWNFHGQRVGHAPFSLLTLRASQIIYCTAVRSSMAVDLGEDPPYMYIYTAITCMPISNRIPR